MPVSPKHRERGSSSSLIPIALPFFPVEWTGWVLLRILPNTLHCRARNLSLLCRDGRTGHDVGHGPSMAGNLNLLAGLDAIQQGTEGIFCLKGSDLQHEFLPPNRLA